MRRATSRTVGVVPSVGVMAALAAPGAWAALAAEAPTATPGNWITDRRQPAVQPPQEAAGGASKSALEIAVNPRRTGQVCGTDTVDEVQGLGPMKLSLTSSRAIASTWNSSVSVSPASVSAAVGYSVTDTATYNESGSYDVPAGKYGVLKSHPLYDTYSYDFENIQLGQVVGYGTAQHAVGFCSEGYAT
jgi:hypothetical protein